MTTEQNDLPTQSDEPQQTPPANVDTEPARADPLDDLKPGGLVEKVLERSHPNVREKARELHEQLSKDLATMRNAVANPKILWPLGELPRSSIPNWLVKYDDRCRTNAVLRYCLGFRWQTEGYMTVFDVALQKYMEQPDEFDQVLGDFIPAEFRNEGRAIVDVRDFENGANLTAADDWPVYRLRLQNRRGNPLLGIATGLPNLDLAMRGLRGLTFLGGVTGGGKTSFGMFMGVNALRTHPDLSLLVYSLDMPKTVLLDRLLCLEADIDYTDLLLGSVDASTQAKLEAAEKRLLADVLPRLRIIEGLAISNDRRLWQQITDSIQLLTTCTGTNRVLTIVDYFQLIPVPADKSGIDADFARVGLLQSVQNWTRTNSNPAGMPILAISEVRKGESGREELSIGDLMGSSRLGYAAESVLLLEFPNDAPEGKVVPVRLKIEKGRDGAVRSKIDLLFEHTRSRFREAPQKPAGKKDKKDKPTKAVTKKKPTEEKIDPFAGKEK
jgi:hypothetical protein